MLIQNLIILAIDTSCDETSVAVVKGKRLLSNVLPSQMEYHAQFGGVVPSLAKLAHTKRIDGVVKRALNLAKIKLEDIDIVAVTYGPGLAIALEVGINKAKELARRLNKPLIAVNHMEGHLLSSFVNKNSEVNNSEPKLPALGFLISGGHTEIILVNSLGDYQKLGETLDDSCGEAYDKCGRMLGFGYPAGPVISKLAKENRKNFKVKFFKDNLSLKVIVTDIKDNKTVELPVPMSNSGNLNLSYSGLKTAFSILIKDLKLKSNNDSLTKEEIILLTVAFEYATIEQLKIKLRSALKKHNVKQVWLGGGVIASARVRSELRKVANEFKVETLYPFSKKLTGDNAAMIAISAYYNLKENFKSKTTYLVKDIDTLDRNPSLSL